MQKLRVACVRYLNTLPLIEGLSALPEIELIPAAPSHIADLVRSGEADLGLVSLVDGPGRGSDQPLSVVPAGMIGCDGPTRTVRIFSKVPIERITQLHADTESHTSVVLASLLLAEKTGSAPELVDFDARERIASDDPAADNAWPEAVLMIGDKVVTDSPPAVRYPHQLDLGEAWKDWTGLPFVYAAWMCRAGDLEDEAKRSAIEGAAKLLDRQRRHNATRLDWIVAKNAASFSWPADLAREYLGGLLRFDLDGRALEGARAFFERGSAAGLLPAWDVPTVLVPAESAAPALV